MFVRHEQDAVPADLAGEEGVRGVELRPLITSKDGARTFAMRLFRLEPAGHTPYHAHPWEHEVFVVRGSGELLGADRILPLQEGSAAYVEPGEKHRFRAGERGMVFICCVPNPPP